jgi:phage terminase large subunit-like protein
MKHLVRERLLQLDSSQRASLLRRTLTPHQARLLLRSWRFWARPAQLAPPGDDWRIWLILAGRGFGKTRTAAEWLLERVKDGRARRIALLGRDASDVRRVMIEGESGILACSDPRGRPYYQPSRRLLTFPGGAEATTFSSDVADSTRGPQHDTGWCDEYAALKRSNRQLFFENFELGLRLTGPAGNPPQCVVTTTPKPSDDLKAMRDDELTFVTTGSTYDNAENLDPTFLRKITSTFEGTRVGRQEIHAELLEDVEGAMWTGAILDAARAKRAPRLQRVVVSVDPAATSGTKSDETGIIVAGLGDDGHVYVLADVSCTMRPSGWGSRAVEAFREWGADAIIAEGNNGGEMVEETILAVDPTANVRLLWASTGKRARAEPVAALYETTPMRSALVHHVGPFPKLEKQMCSFTGLAGVRSPDRMDALVWAVHDLLLSGQVDFV